MLKNEVKRKGRWTEIPKQEREAAKRRECSCCHSHYGYMKAFVHGRKFIMVRQHIDHMIPRRWMEEHFFYPHGKNLLSICNHCHGLKKVLEDRLYQGDTIEFMKGLKRMNYPLQRFLMFASQLGVKEFDGWNL